MSSAGPKLPVKRAFSSGGVVFRQNGVVTEVVICGHQDAGVWALPKGTPRKGERLAETAMREVQEETGLQVEVLDKIGFVQYWFIEEATRFFKTVYYYLLRPTGGHISDHDQEFDEVRWVSVPEALRLLTYKNDSDIVRQAVEMIQARGDAPHPKDTVV